ncbi:cohesin subunit SA-3 isoform X5 [Chamaea fasciata]|uniref:cohesin subunit SA-3 isoform X5 n=1 Tax=Chamaea fasciata TaxID=190680 RepID=UPI00336AD303
MGRGTGAGMGNPHSWPQIGNPAPSRPLQTCSDPSAPEFPQNSQLSGFLREPPLSRGPPRTPPVPAAAPPRFWRHEPRDGGSHAHSLPSPRPFRPPPAMAPGRSPRLHPSGSSSGSSSGRTRGSGARSSSPGSPHSPEFPDDADSGSDFEVSPRPRSKRGPPQGATRSHVPKRSRLAGDAGKELEQNSLFQAVFSGKAAMETVVDEWLGWYRRDQEPAFLELLNFIVASCGCRGAVTPAMFRELPNSEIIRRLTETFDEAAPAYPLARRSPAWRRFRAGFSELLELLALRGRHRELRAGLVPEALPPFLAGLADSRVRACRHAATLAALKLMSSLVEVALDVGLQLENCRRQLEAEQGKEPGRRGTEKLELLREQQRELRERQQELEELMNGIFKGVFVHRYRDVVPEIRGICLEELGKWVRKFPGSFLTDSHLKYLGWTLHDKHGAVRLRCARALRGLYGAPGSGPGLELFTERFKPRLVAMVHDKEPRVALEVLRLLTELDRNLEEALSEEDCRSIFPVVFVSSRALATAAGEFLFQRLLDPQRHGAGPGDNRSFFLRLVGFFLGSELHDHAAYLVDSLWDCAGSRLRDWDTAAGMLLAPGAGLDLGQEQALVEILSCSGLRLCRGRPPVGRAQGRKVSSREQREERSRLSRSLIPVLPQLLEKNSRFSPQTPVLSGARGGGGAAGAAAAPGAGDVPHGAVGEVPGAAAGADPGDFREALGALPGAPSLSQFVPVCPSLSQFIPVCPSLSQFIPVCPSPSQFVPVCPGVRSQCLEQLLGRIQEIFGKHSEPSPVLPVCPSLSQFVPVYPSLSQCVPVCPSVSQCVPVSVPSAWSSCWGGSRRFSGSTRSPPRCSQFVPVCPSLSQFIPVHPSVSQCVPVSVPSAWSSCWGGSRRFSGSTRSPPRCSRRPRGRCARSVTPRCPCTASGTSPGGAWGTAWGTGATCRSPRCSRRCPRTRRTFTGWRPP